MRSTYFFFFKQKTAYEMRISDWSSDVCSSDLKPVDTAGMQASILFTEGEARKGTVALKPAGDRLEGAGKIPPGADAVVSLRTQIGRASCRDRGCQDV